MFEDVEMICFVVDVSGYRKKLSTNDFEDMNFLRYQLDMFDTVCNSRAFHSVQMTLFFNKIDLFEKYLSKNPFKDYFPEYTGNHHYK